MKTFELTYELTKDSAPPNRGWVVDYFKFVCENENVGYVKMAYIPKSNIPVFYPNGIVDFLDEILGWCGFKEKFDQESICSMHLPERVRGKCKAEVLRFLEKEYGSLFKSFLKYFVDNPYEDFIFVDENFRGKDLSFTMVLQVANYYNSIGMPYFISGLRCGGASQRLFEKLKSHDRVQKKRFSYGKKYRWYFPPMSN